LHESEVTSQRSNNRKLEMRSSAPAPQWATRREKLKVP